MQALWMLLASVFFATMGVCIKFASAHFNSFEIVCYRGIFGVLFLFGLTRARGVSLRSSVPMMHVWRSIVGTVSLTAWFYSIAILPLGTAMTLNYMSSIWIATFLLGGALLLQHLLRLETKLDERAQEPLNQWKARHSIQPYSSNWTLQNLKNESKVNSQHSRHRRKPELVVEEELKM